MAIYKNREVQVVGPSSQANTPTTINVSYSNGSHENVKLGDVRFTQAEKTQLNKSYPGIYNDVQTVTDEDLTSVRVGVAPTFDTAEKEQALARAQHQKQVDISNKRVEAAKTKAEQDISKQVNNPTLDGRPMSPTQVSQTTPPAPQPTTNPQTQPQPQNQPVAPVQPNHTVI